MSDMVLTLTINAEALKRGVVEVQGKLSELQKKKVDIDTDAAAKKLKALRESILMAGLAITGMVATVTAAIRPALEAEAALSGMEASLRNTGIYTVQFSKALQDNATALQQVTIYEDDAILSATGLMQSIGHLSQDQLPAAQKAAIGLASAFRINLETAFELVGKASAGNTALLSRYGIVLDSTLDPAEKFAKVLELGASKFDLAEAAAKTGAGQIEQFKNAWGNMIESIGQTALPLINGILSVVKPMVELFGEMNTVLKATVVILPILAAAYYRMTAAQVTAGAVTGSLSIALTAAKVALQGFVTAMGPLGLGLIAISAAVSAGAFLFTAWNSGADSAGEAAESLTSRMASVTSGAESQKLKFDALAQSLLSLKKNTNSTKEDKELMAQTITDLNENYSEYLGNINLEKAGYNELAAALEKASGALMAHATAKALANLQQSQIEEIVKLQMQINAIPANRKPAQTTIELTDKMRSGVKGFAGINLESVIGTGESDKIFGEYNTLNEKLFKAKRDLKLISGEYGKVLASLPKLASSSGSGSGTAESAKISAAQSELQKLQAELDAYFMDADAKLTAEYQKRSAIIMANTVKDSAEQKAMITELDAWKTAEEGKLNEERTAKMMAWLSDEVAQRNRYYDEVKFQDANYYGWKRQQIIDEVNAMELSGDRQESLIKKRIEELDAEKAAWDALPLEEVKTRYQAFKQEMASGKDIGIQSWKSILDGLLAFRAELLKLGDTPGVAAILKQLDSEINEATANATRRQSFFWSNIMGFDPDSAADKEKIARVKASFSTMQTDVTNILGGLQTLNTNRRDQELAAIDAVAAKEGINDAEAIRRKEAVTKKYAQEAKKIGAIQKAVSITQATIHTAESAVAAYKAMVGIPVVGPVLAAAAAAAAIASGAVQIAIIRAQKFASGGRITGPGTGTSDSIPIMASNGEFVVNAASTRRYLPVLNAINGAGSSGPAFAAGGMVLGNNWLEKLAQKIDLVNMNLANLDLAVTVVNHAPDVKTQVERYEHAKARQIARGKDYSFGSV